MKNLGDSVNAVLEHEAEYPEIVNRFKEIIGWIPSDEEEPDQSLSFFIGGNLYVVEEPEDLLDISTTVFRGTHYLSLFETADIFDICEWMPGNRFVEICNITNNSGGNTYYVPSHLVTENVKKSIILTRNIL